MGDFAGIGVFPETPFQLQPFANWELVKGQDGTSHWLPVESTGGELVPIKDKWVYVFMARSPKKQPPRTLEAILPSVAQAFRCEFELFFDAKGELWVVDDNSAIHAQDPDQRRLPHRHHRVSADTDLRSIPEIKRRRLIDDLLPVELKNERLLYFFFLSHVRLSTASVAELEAKNYTTFMPRAVVELYPAPRGDMAPGDAAAGLPPVIGILDPIEVAFSKHDTFISRRRRFIDFATTYAGQPSSVRDEMRSRAIKRAIATLLREVHNNLPASQQADLNNALDPGAIGKELGRYEKEKEKRIKRAEGAVSKLLLWLRDSRSPFDFVRSTYEAVRPFPPPTTNPGNDLQFPERGFFTLIDHFDTLVDRLDESLHGRAFLTQMVEAAQKANPSGFARLISEFVLPAGPVPKDTSTGATFAMAQKAPTGVVGLWSGLAKVYLALKTREKGFPRLKAVQDLELHLANITRLKLMTVNAFDPTDVRVRRLEFFRGVSVDRVNFREVRVGDPAWVSWIGAAGAQKAIARANLALGVINLYLAIESVIKDQSTLR